MKKAIVFALLCLLVFGTTVVLAQEATPEVTPESGQGVTVSYPFCTHDSEATNPDRVWTNPVDHEIIMYQVNTVLYLFHDEVVTELVVGVPLSREDGGEPGNQTAYWRWFNWFWSEDGSDFLFQNVQGDWLVVDLSGNITPYTDYMYNSFPQLDALNSNNVVREANKDIAHDWEFSPTEEYGAYTTGPGMALTTAAIADADDIAHPIAAFETGAVGSIEWVSEDTIVLYNHAEQGYDWLDTYGVHGVIYREDGAYGLTGEILPGVITDVLLHEGQVCIRQIRFDLELLQAAE